MKIYAFSKKEISEYIHSIFNNFILISITGPEAEGGEFIELESEYMLDRLYLRISDTNKNSWSSTENSIYCDEKIAKEVYDFCKKYENDVEYILVQCDAGVSRSAGMAAALSKYYNGDDTPFFRSLGYIPNMEIYSTILKYFMKKQNEND